LPTLLNLIADENGKKTQTPLSKIFDFNEIKYKERDEIANIINSWHSKVPFSM
jgi:hypothetical protein